MNPFSFGDNAFGALQSVTGGHAGPSSAGMGETNQHFSGGAIHFAPTGGFNFKVIVVIAVVAVGMWFATKKG